MNSVGGPLVSYICGIKKSGVAYSNVHLTKLTQAFLTRNLFLVAVLSRDVNVEDNFFFIVFSYFKPTEYQFENFRECMYDLSW